MVQKNIFDERGVDTELNEFKIAVCDNQGLLFQDCQWDFEADANDFIEKFMNSDVAASMDNTVSPFHNTGTKQLGESLLKEVVLKPIECEYKNSDILYWIGYIYRYWVWWLGDTSKEVYKKADYATMDRLYSYLHMLSPELAILKLREPSHGIL